MTSARRVSLELETVGVAGRLKVRSFEGVYMGVKRGKEQEEGNEGQKGDNGFPP